METKLSDRMSLGHKLRLMFDYLKGGGEIDISGRTYVWCDNLVLRTEVDDSGQEVHYGINGLAIKTKMTTRVPGVYEPHYIGQNDITLDHLFQLVDAVAEEDWLGMGASLALRSMTKQR